MKRTVPALLTLVLATLLFGAAVALRDDFDPWLTNLATGLLGGTLAMVVLWRRRKVLFSFDWRGALLAFALGAGMVALTHAGYSIATSMFPPIGDTVRQLYLDIAPTSPPTVVLIPLVLIIVVAEELLWRGVAFELLEGRVQRRALASVSALLYATPQVIGGAWLLVCAALGLGFVVGLQRVHTERLAESVITHATWSISIFGLLPLA